MKHKRWRIVLLIGFGIVIPCLLLGYLAFRGVRNDQALWERERLSEYRQVADRIMGSIDASLSVHEQTFLAFLTSRDEQDDISFSSLEKLIQQEAWIAEVFTLDEDDTIRFPGTRLLYVPDSKVPSPRKISLDAETRRIISRGEALEFQDKRLSQALREYRQALSRQSDPVARADALSKIARIQKKSGQSREALKTYKILGEDYSRIRIPDGVPWGLAARIEEGALHLTLEESSQAISGYLELYRELLLGNWILSRDQFDLYTSRITDLLEECIPQENTPSFREDFESLREKEKTGRVVAERLQVFGSSAAAYLVTPSSSPEGTLAYPGKRLSFSIGRQEFLVSWIGVIMPKREGWGTLIDPQALKRLTQAKVLENLVPDDGTAWVIRRRDGEVISVSSEAPTGGMTIEADFTEGFPPWSLELYGPDMRFFETILTTRRGIFFYMFILIGGILIFGLIFAIRSVTHELELSRMKSDFVSTVSHEFKSPLTSIRQITEMLESGRVPSEERRQKYYEVLLQQSERLSLLIENVLSFAKMEEGKKKFMFAATDIDTLLQDAVSAARDRVEHMGFTIDLKIPTPLPIVSADRTALSQAISNLLDNAIKYSGDSRRIGVRVHIDAPFLVLSVKDNGVGIDKHELDRIFDRFYRGGDRLTRTIKGSGLGLTLVRQIIEAHKGEVRVESQLGGGSEFSILLPLEEKER